ncbi:MAG: oligosaccharide flippase family protein [Desulfobacterales bacterium]|nr:MAG: oligosaccharide flippase family protein [Desulfobacterales bacterium]
MRREETPLGIAQRAISGTLHVAFSSYAVQTIDFFRSLVLARLLIPEYFGVLSLATFYLYFFGIIHSWGFNFALIHRKEKLEQAFAGHFLLTTTMAVLTFLVVFVSSPLILVKFSPHLLEQPQNYHDVVMVIRILAFLGILQAIGGTPRIYLEKNLRFRAIAITEIVSTILSTLVALGFAWCQPNLYALLIWRISASLLPSVFVWFISPWRLSLKTDMATIKWFFRYGATMLPSAPLTLFFLKFDDYLAGTLCGLMALGLYAKAYSFSLIPLQFISSIVSRVAGPTYAKLQNDRQELSKAFAYTTRNIVRVSGLFALILPSVATEFVLIVLGDQWLGLVPILRILFVYAWLRPLINEFGVLYTAVGRPKYVLIEMASMMPMIVGGGFYLTSQFGLNGLAVSVDMMVLQGTVVGCFLCKRIVDVQFIKLLAPSALAAGFSFLTLVLYSSASLVVNPYANFFIKLGIVSLAYIFIIHLLEKKELKFDVKYLLEISRARC